jgi:hypothetical protein
MKESLPTTSIESEKFIRIYKMNKKEPHKSPAF